MPARRRGLQPCRALSRLRPRRPQRPRLSSIQPYERDALEILPGLQHFAEAQMADRLFDLGGVGLPGDIVSALYQERLLVCGLPVRGDQDRLEVMVGRGVLAPRLEVPGILLRRVGLLEPEQ